MVADSGIRMCKSIGVDLATGAAAMDKLLGRPFSAERDRRAEAGANAQRKGQISRQLKVELLKVVNDGDDCTLPKRRRRNALHGALPAA